MANTLRGFAKAYGSGSSTTLASGALSTDPVAGDAVRVVVSGYGGNWSCTIADNASGNTYTKLTATRFYANGLWCEIWECDNINTITSFEVTVTYASASTARSVTAVAIAGAATASATDKSGGQTVVGDYSGTDILTTGSIGTPTTDGQFILAAGFGLSSPDNFNPGTGYTGLGTYTYNEIFRVEYKIQATAAEVFGTFSQDNPYGSANWFAIGCTVKAAAVEEATLEQEGYRGLNDDGAESAATFAAAQDAGFTVTPGVVGRFRDIINATGDPDAGGYQVDYRKQGETPWIPFGK